MSIENDNNRPVSLTAYIESLTAYSDDDYYTEKPYLDMYRHADGKVGLLEQFRSFLTKDAVSKGVDGRVVYFYINYLVEADEAAFGWITSPVDIIRSQLPPLYFEDMENKPLPVVIPLICGSGKSTAITKYLINLLRLNQDPNVPSKIQYKVWAYLAEKVQAICGNSFEIKTFGGRQVEMPKSEKAAIDILVSKKAADTEWCREILGKATSKLEKLYRSADTSNIPEDDKIPICGVTIVTDSIARAADYWNAEKIRNNPFFSEDEVEFIRQHRNLVTELKADNLREAERNISHAPVLIMTTQRYFDVLSKEDIAEHIFRGTYNRCAVIFDEQPYLSKIDTIVPSDFNDISTALYEIFDDESNPDDRFWCLDQWEKTRSRYLALFKEYEQSADIPDLWFYKDPSGTVTDDDCRFFRIIEDHKSQFDGNLSISKVYDKIKSVRVLCTEWSIYSFRKKNTGEYNIHFAVFRSNKDKVIGQKASFIILDGTGDISPMYDEEYICKANGSSFNRDLSKLNIRIVNLPTDKRTFTKRGNLIAKAVAHYLRDVQKLNTGDTVLFTHEASMGYFIDKAGSNAKLKELGFDKQKTQHFGAIKGFNSWNSDTLFTQVGTLRLPASYYYAQYIGQRPELQEALLSLIEKPEELKAEFEKLLPAVREIAERWMLTDIDQNIFRGVIRNADNDQTETYYIFMDIQNNFQLIRSIKERYEKWNATVSVDPSFGFKALPFDLLTNDLKLEIWYDNWNDGTIKTKVNICDESGVPLNVFAEMMKAKKPKPIILKLKEAKEHAKAHGPSGNRYYLKPLTE